MPISSPLPMRSRRQAGFTGVQIAGIVALTALVTVGVTWWVLRTWVFPTQFQPVQLTSREAQVLDTKLRAIGLDPASLPGAPPSARNESRPDVATPRRDASPSSRDKPIPLEPEPYREDPARREITISEREFNALLAHNTNLGERLAIDFSEDLASAKLLVPVDPDFPMFGGRILRVSAGVELRIADGRPVVMLRGISLMGVPLPNAWLGNLKQVDLVQEFGGRGGFWSAFASGIDQMQVRDGELRLLLAE